MRVEKRAGSGTWERVQSALPVVYFMVVIFLLTFDDGWVLDHIGWWVIGSLLVVAIVPVLASASSARPHEGVSRRRTGVFGSHTKL